MKRTFIENLILFVAWSGLIGGILCSFLYSYSTFTSGREMCFPQAVVFLFAGVFASVGCWAVLMEIIALADRLRRLENRKEQPGE